MMPYSNRLLAASADLKISIEALKGAVAFRTLCTLTPSHKIRGFSQDPIAIYPVILYTCEDENCFERRAAYKKGIMAACRVRSLSYKMFMEVSNRLLRGQKSQFDG